MYELHLLLGYWFLRGIMMAGRKEQGVPWNEKYIIIEYRKKGIAIENWLNHITVLKEVDVSGKGWLYKNTLITDFDHDPVSGVVLEK